jgi:hypothetical protein
MIAGVTGSARGQPTEWCCASTLEEADSRDLENHQNKHDHQQLVAAHCRCERMVSSVGT